MSIEGEIASVAVPAWVRLALKLAPFAIIAVLFAALMTTRATLHDARQEAKILAANDAADAAKEQAKWATDGKNAAETYATNMANRQPIILHATDTVREYAQTPAGAAVCAAPDIVSRTDALDRSLWPARAPASAH